MRWMVYNDRLETFVHVDPETLKEVMRRALNKAERNAKTRRLPEEFIDMAVEEIEKHPYGRIMANSGVPSLSYHYAAISTIMLVYWYTWRRTKWIKLSIERTVAAKHPHGESAIFKVSHNKKRVWKKVFPQRFCEFRQKQILRQLRRTNLPVPEDLSYVTKFEIWPKTPIAWIHMYSGTLPEPGFPTDKTKDVLSTPDGIIELPQRWVQSATLRDILISTYNVPFTRIKNMPWKKLSQYVK